MTSLAPHTALHEHPISDPTPPVAPAVYLNVVAWPDPVLCQRGYDPRSAYVERFWLGVLGPSATWLMRRLARGLDEKPEGFRINLADTGRALGLGEGTGRNSAVVRTIERACQFGVAQQHGRDSLAVRCHLAPLTRRQLTRLPASLQAAHDRWMAEPLEGEQRRRAVATAVGLLRRGEDAWAIERHLASWGCSEPLAYAAVADARRLLLEAGSGDDFGPTTAA